MFGFIKVISVVINVEKIFVVQALPLSLLMQARWLKYRHHLETRNLNRSRATVYFVCC